jgi:uncharacterized protein involved in type VI secretion and phage assembly
MSLPEMLLQSAKEKDSDKIYGVVTALVTNNKDPDGLGRVKVKYPWLSDEDEGYWARIASPMAGKERGLYFLPEVNDEVLVIFEQGDWRFPYVLGALWNGRDAPPVKNDNGKNDVRMIKSRSGHVVRLTDTDGQEKIEIIDRSQRNAMVFDTAQNTITITAGQDIILSAKEGTIKLEAQQIEIKSAAGTTIESGGSIEVKASAIMNVKGAVVNIN